MATGMWTSVSGAAAQSLAVDTVANNLANANTDGYKKDLPAFKEYLSSAEREGDFPQINPGPIQDRHLNPILDKDQSHVVVEGTYTLFKPGPLKITKSLLDVALEGPGMIEVNSPQGLRYTRLGSLKIAQDGKLVTNDGYPVLMSKPGGSADPNADVTSRFINLRDRGPISVTNEGEIFADGNLVGKLSIVEFTDSKFMRKVGMQYFENKDPTKNPIVEGRNTRVHQGMIEGSNVNPVEEMTNLIKANRLFEHDLKVMKTYGELLGREANDIGRL